MGFIEGIAIWKLAVIGLLAGILSSLFGIGSGIVLVPALVVVAALTQKQAQGISLAVIVPIALIGFLRYYYTPGVNLNLKIILPIILAAIVGVNIGASVLGNISNRNLQFGFGALIIIVGFSMIWKAVKHG